MTSFKGATAWIQAQSALLPDVNYAPVYPPEASMKFPLAVCYVQALQPMRKTANLTVTLATLRWELHVARFDLPRDVERVTDIGLAAYQIILDDMTLGGAVDTVQPEGINGSLITLQYPTVTTLCWRFDIQTKITGS